jgi:hypothetical protein
MTPASLINECRESGVRIDLAGGALKLVGAPNAVRIAADRLRPFKSAIVKHLTATPVDGTETWGPYTPYCCAISPALVTELHTLIARFAQLYNLSAEATARIIDVAKKQPAASVPEAVRFFKAEIDQISPQGDRS